MYRLTTDEFLNNPLAWSSDSREVIPSDRGGTLQIYKQALKGGNPAPVTSAPGMDFYIARRSPDGGSLVVEPSLIVRKKGLPFIECLSWAAPPIAGSA